MCLLYDGSTRRLTESGFMWFHGFMEKPGIEPATPGLQGIALIHYTTGASLVWPCSLAVPAHVVNYSIENKITFLCLKCMKQIKKSGFSKCKIRTLKMCSRD